MLCNYKTPSATSTRSALYVSIPHKLGEHDEIYLSGFRDRIRWKRFSWRSRSVLDLTRQKFCGGGSREGVNIYSTCTL